MAPGATTKRQCNGPVHVQWASACAMGQCMCNGPVHVQCCRPSYPVVHWVFGCAHERKEALNCGEQWHWTLPDFFHSRVAAQCPGGGGGGGHK